MEYKINNLEETKKLAHIISNVCQSGSVILLNGDLGAGKTTFTHFLINSLMSNDVNVTSPTFNIMQIYDGRDYPIYHLDFYRLEDGEELYELGLDESMSNALTIIEWSNKFNMTSFLSGLGVISIYIELVRGSRSFKIQSNNLKLESIIKKHLAV